MTRDELLLMETQIKRKRTILSFLRFSQSGKAVSVWERVFTFKLLMGIK